MFLGNETRNQNKCKDNNVSYKVHASPCSDAGLQLKEHKSTTKILHGTVVEKPAGPIIVVTILC